MEEYIKWLENKIEICLEDKDLQREHWAFCQALKKYRELALRQPPVSVAKHPLPRPLEAWKAAREMELSDYIEWHLEQERRGNER